MPLSEDELLNELRRLGSLPDDPPTVKEMTENGQYGRKSYSRRWGSWNNALRAAGYTPNAEMRISETKLLNAIQELADELNHPPTAVEMENQGKYSARPYKDRYHSWWTAVVRAGCRPAERSPLHPKEFHKFYKASLQLLQQKQTLTGLMFLFTGITPQIFVNFSKDWVRELADEYIVRVPKTETESGEFWEFRLPATWTNHYTDQEEKTRLPGLLDWYFSSYDSIKFNQPASVIRCLLRIAKTAELSNERGTKSTEPLGVVPRIRADDLRITHGVHLARQGAPKSVINRRLGIDHIPSKFDIQEIFIWLNEHEDNFSHPDYNPP